MSRRRRASTRTARALPACRSRSWSPSWCAGRSAVPEHRVRPVRRLQRARSRRRSASSVDRARCASSRWCELGRADDRGGHAGLVQQPGQRHLRRRHAALAGDLADASTTSQVAGVVVQLVGELVGLGAGVRARRRPRGRLPASKPRASGLHGMTPTPWSRHSGIISRSSSR